MRSITTILTPPPGPELVTLDDMKLELGITDTSEDDVLAIWIAQASQIVASYCNLTLAVQTVSQVFRHSLGPRGDYFTPRFCYGLNGESEEALMFACAPVSSITSITVDGSLLGTSLYELDHDKVFRLNASGYPSPWTFTKAITAVYISGFSVGVDVPEDLQAAVMTLVRDYRGTATREDPNLKRRRTDGVSELEWWVSESSKTTLPITVSGLLDTYKLRWGWMR